MDNKKKTLGELIRFYRMQKTQMHNHHVWSQEDLAVAIGSDKAHINRIENGKQIPAQPTLCRICDALELNWSQRRELMSTAGYIWANPPVSESDAEAVRIRMAPHMQKMEHPAVLQDKDNIMWYVNDLEAYTFYGYPSAEKMLEDCQGFRMIEMLMTPSISKWFEKVIVDYEEYLKRQIMRFMEIYYPHRYDLEYQNILNNLLHIEEYRIIWNELLEQKENEEVIFLNHQILQVKHPDIGFYSVQIWHSDLAMDDRFVLVQHIANDEETRELFSEIKKRMQKGK